MKLWHDDTRYPPTGWTWAQNNDQARELLSINDVTEISMDHDMGANPGEIWAAGNSEDNGLVLAKWMVEYDLVPPVITIHSWNHPRARQMAQVFNDAGYDVTLAPYQIPQPDFA